MNINNIVVYKVCFMLILISLIYNNYCIFIQLFNDFNFNYQLISVFICLFIYSLNFGNFAPP